MEELLDAATRGDTQALRAAIVSLPAVEAEAALGRALFTTIFKDRFESFVVLLEYGANVNYQNNAGETCFHRAISTELPLPYLNRLKERGANMEMQDVNGSRPIHIACTEESLACVTYLLENGVNVDCQNSNLETPLHIACEKGFEDIVNVLLHYEAGRELQRLDGSTALHIACQMKRERCANILLAMGAEKESRDYEQNTPLMIAASENSLACLVLLIQSGADVNARNLLNETALHLACVNVDTPSSLSLFQNLVAGGADVNIRTLNDGETPIHLVCAAGFPSFLEVLLGAQEVDPDVINNDGETALHTLVSTHFVHVQVQLAMTRMLLIVANRAIEDNDGNTAADVAVHPMVRDLLLE